MRPTSADASECYENYIDELKKQGFRLREDFTPEATQLASGKLQAVRSIYPCCFVSLTEYFNRGGRRKEWELGKGKASLRGGPARASRQAQLPRRGSGASGPLPEHHTASRAMGRPEAAQWRQRQK